MIKKSGKYLADWRDENGHRKRRAFQSRQSAMQFQEKMKDEVRSKRIHRLKPPSNSPELRRQINRPSPTRDGLEVLDRERVIRTIELRNALIAEAKRLLPSAIRQARGSKGKPGSPALLKMIANLAMEPIQADLDKRRWEAIWTLKGRIQEIPGT
jgi:hypothetical protein